MLKGAFLEDFMTRATSRGNLEDLVPVDAPNRRAWASDVWRNRRKIAAVEGGVWLLRQAANTLARPKAEVDEFFKPRLL
jgi:hypothetical protein